MTKRREHFAAVILSAGFSSRMGGRFKPLLPLGGATVLAAAVKAFKAAGVSDIVVVTGHRAEEVRAEAEKQGARPVFNPRYEEGMFSSVQTGVSAIGDASAAFFVLPVDIPLVAPETISGLMEHYIRENRPVWYPCFDGRRGHPPLIDADLLPEINAHSGEGGLKSVLRRHDRESGRLDVKDEFILLDIDTNSDYKQLLEKVNRTLTETK